MTLKKVDKIFQNGKFVTQTGIFDGGVAVESGKIVAVTLNTKLYTADDIIDLNGKIVLPGIIDNHVHFGPDREDYVSGTQAAASSGVTTISDMPTGNPGVLNSVHLEEKKRYADKHAYIDFALFGGAGSDNHEAMQEMANGGIVAYKTYMVGSSGCSCGDDGKILKLLKEAAKTGVVTGWHAENDLLIDPLTEELKEAGRIDPMAHVESRPNYSEYEAISKLILFNKIANARLHIIHLSTKEGLELIKAAKADGMRITAETCPHYLLLNSKYMEKVGPYAKIIPPLRSEEDRLAMWRGIMNGTIDYICSDHAPHPKRSKDIGWENIWLAENGNPGVETLLPLMLDQVNKGNISIQQVAYNMSTRPAQVFDLFPKKGNIMVGSDADLTVVDLDAEWNLTSENMYSKSKDTSIFEGWNIKGKPILTVVRGEVVAEDGVITGEMGFGKFQRRLK
jgi:dihydropyrimidinase/allantoinase